MPRGSFNTNVHPAGQILVPKPEMKSCKECGTEFPVAAGEDFANCREWSRSALKRLPWPCPLSIFLELTNFGTLCRVTQLVSSGLELVDDPDKTP